MAKTNWGVLRGRGTWILQTLLALVFLFTSYRKFTGHPVPVETIDASGADQWVRITIGVVELFGAVGLMMPCFALTAAAGLSLLMLGATYTHLFLIGGSPVEAIILLVASLAVVLLRSGIFPRT